MSWNYPEETSYRKGIVRRSTRLVCYCCNNKINMGELAIFAFDDKGRYMYPYHPDCLPFDEADCEHIFNLEQ